MDSEGTSFKVMGSHIITFDRRCECDMPVFCQYAALWLRTDSFWKEVKVFSLQFLNYTSISQIKLVFLKCKQPAVLELLKRDEYSSASTLLKCQLYYFVVCALIFYVWVWSTFASVACSWHSCYFYSSTCFSCVLADTGLCFSLDLGRFRKISSCNVTRVTTVCCVLTPDVTFVFLQVCSHSFWVCQLS